MGSTVGGSRVSTTALNFGRSAMSRAVRVKLSNRLARCWSTRPAASARSRCSSASASARSRLLTKKTAKPIDTVASRVLARKIRLVSEPSVEHHGTTSSTSTTPPAGTVIDRELRASPSYQATTV